MPGHDRADEKLKDLLKGAATSPVRWERVDLLARRGDFRASLGLLVVAVVLTAVLSVGAIAGKTALDPSFSPPILSHASASIELSRPRLGWAMVPSGRVQSGTHSPEGRGLPSAGYLMQASLEVEGAEEEPLLVDWQLRKVRGSISAASAGRSRPERVSPVSGDEAKGLRQWLPMPQSTGRYVVEVDLRSLGGGTIANARSVSFYVLGRDCCETYKAPTYVARLPRSWPLQEDYAPQSGSRYVTLARGPYENSLDIDLTLGESRSALERADELEGLLATNGIGYRRLSRRILHFGGRPAVEWSYELEGDAFTNILFSRGSSAFAVLGRSNQDHFRETRDLARLVARSVKPRR